LAVGALIAAVLFLPGIHSVWPIAPESLGPGASVAPQAHGRKPPVAGFGTTIASSDARYLADWIAASGDNQDLAFIIVDKKDAKAYVFDRDARLAASTFVLIGAARGDDTVPGIGAKAIADVRPEERTTPAGRFVAQRGHNALGKDVIWVDYDNAVSLHRVVTSNPQEHRLQRIASDSIDDKRISYGCINVPAAFFDAHIRPIFAVHRAVVYVMPEFRRLDQVFGSYPVDGAQAGRP
jgi:hypothetical protein